MFIYTKIWPLITLSEKIRAHPEKLLQNLNLHKIAG
jgi:hypothetical protein